MRPTIGITIHASALILALLLGFSLSHAQTNAGRSCPIDLSIALRLAGAQNLDLQLARGRFKEALAGRTLALEKFFPWLAAGAQYHNREGKAQAVPSGIVSEAHYYSYSPGVTITSQTDLGDAIYKALAAKQLVRAAAHEVETRWQDATFRAALGYFDLLKAKALVDVARESLRVSQIYERELRNAVATGIAFKGDELRVQTQTERYRISLRQAQEQQRISAAVLAQILHLDPTIELIPENADLAPLVLIESGCSLDALVQRALVNRPELREFAERIGAAYTTKQGAIYGPLVPSLGIQAFLGRFGGGPDRGPDNSGSTSDLVITGNWKIGPGGLFDLGRIRSSEARLEVTQISAEKMRDQVIREVVEALARIKSLQDQMAFARNNVATADKTLRLTRERKQYGVGIVLEDIQAQQALTQARSDYVTSIAEFNKAQFALNKAVGNR